MQDDKFATLTCMLGMVFEEFDQGKTTAHVAIASPNNYNLSFNIAAKSVFPNVTGEARTIAFTEENFIDNLPPEFKLDLTFGQLKDLFRYLKSARNIVGMERGQDIGTSEGTLFLFTDNEIILIMREEYSLAGQN